MKIQIVKVRNALSMTLDDYERLAKKKDFLPKNHRNTIIGRGESHET